MTKSIFGLFEFGEYIDLANANKINVSPKPRGFKEGEFYCFVYDNTIYLNPEKFTAETPIHEYTHLWAEALRQRNPNEWKKIVAMMKETPEIWNYVQKTYPGLVYHKWLVGIKKAGYATAPDYVKRCEKIILQYKLFFYDILATKI